MKKKEIEKLIENYENNIIDITKVFCKKYFGDCYKYNDDDWVSIDIGGVISINDYFFNFNDILIAIKYKATKKELFGYYDYSLDNYQRNKFVPSFEYYLKYFRGFSFKKIDTILKKQKNDI